LTTSIGGVFWPWRRSHSIAEYLAPFAFAHVEVREVAEPSASRRAHARW
jgi:hypothetical protein